MHNTIYTHFPRLEWSQRQWPSKTLTKHPTWCSIDLREGSQSLPTPMNISRKLALFHLLIQLGFKEIEVASPAIADDEFQFVRLLIDEHLIPNNVTIQVISQMKTTSIDRAFEAIQGAKKAIVHLYNTTSMLRRSDVFETNPEELISKAITTFRYAKQLAAKMPETDIHFEYSPEGFNTTEPALAIRIVNAVIDEVKPTEEHPLIINLQATMEADLPNVFADQVEYLISQIHSRENVIISIQPHNDRGCAIAAAELGQLAGATRVEGTLLGNGERAGVADILTLALNLHTQGIESGLHIEDINEIMDIYENCTELSVSPRHPYAGELVFTTFSAPHQFAIHEGLKAYEESGKTFWHVPYLPMNPEDIGRGREDIIRLTTQSGRSGLAYVMEKFHGYRLPVNMQKEFSLLVKKEAIQKNREITADDAWDIFMQEYLKAKKPFELKSIYFEKDKDNSSQLNCNGELLFNGEKYDLVSSGNGVIDTVINYLNNKFNLNLIVDDYYQHALSHGSDSIAASYIRVIDQSGNSYWGAGIDNDATLATLRALISAVNRAAHYGNAFA